jgi:hypothetical protein
MVKRSQAFHFALFTFLVSILTGMNVPAWAGETPFSHKDLYLILPDGWLSQEIPSNFEKEVIAWLKSDKIAGASIMVFCYKGWRQNYNSIRIAGLKTIGASYPKGQEMLKKPEKNKTNTGLTAVWEYWRGAVDAGGQTVFLESPVGIFEAKSGWILMLGFTPASSGPQLEEGFMEILKSAK